MTSPAVSVLIPTIGRRELLRSCLESVLRCVDGPDEVVIVDQSGGDDIAALVDALDDRRLRRIPSDERGIAAAMNLGLGAARNDLVMVTHDDCTVEPDWVSTGRALIAAHPKAMLTGRVLAPPGIGYVPSTRDDPEPHDHTGEVTSGLLYPANMAVDRREVLAIGGFDERPTLRVAGEDNDLCYRWLRDGRPFRYEPSLVVWHHDWRTPEQIVRTHIGYARAQGAFYAKHLRAGDERIRAMLRWDLRHGVRSVVRGTFRRTPRWEDPYREMVFSLLAGLVRGWRDDRRRERQPPPA